MSKIKFDPTNLFIGVSKQDLKNLQPKLKQAEKNLKKLFETDEQVFFILPFDLEGLKFIESKAREVQKKFKRLIVIGIGGSDLGARAIHQALPGQKMELRFISNPDPETVSSVLNLSNEEWQKTAINVVSKSGSTLETAANFLVAREKLIKAVGKNNHSSHVFVTTDPGSKLEIWARENSYEVLEHPKNVGGRFSVLSVVGLFPAACSGVPITKLLAGARELKFAEASKFAALQYLSYKAGKSIQVLMPYSDRLANFTLWYRQLWAESLGKENQGPTPLAAFGAVDQHSQIQLFTEGPNDKTITFINVEKFASRAKIPKGMSGLEYAVGRDLADILHAELKGTAGSLTKNQRPNATISIPSITPETLGELFQFFMVATAYSGELYGINTFNQPGVEEGKRLARKVLGEG